MAATTWVSGRRVQVGQGEHRVSGEPNMLLSTIFGPCVAACLRDQRMGIGGTNHLLLPESEGIEKAERRKVRETAQVAGGSVELF